MEQKTITPRVQSKSGLLYGSLVAKSDMGSVELGLVWMGSGAADPKPVEQSSLHGYSVHPCGQCAPQTPNLPSALWPMLQAWSVVDQ